MATRVAKARLTDEEQVALRTWRQPPPVQRRQVRRKPGKGAIAYQNAVAGLRAIPIVTPAEILHQWRTTLSARQWAVVFGSVALVVAVAMLLNSPFFAVTPEVTTIYGNERVSADAIYRAGGLDQRNLFRVDTRTVASQISQLPAIASASVRLRLPNQAVIAVREYEPLLVWQATGEPRWIATDGSPIPAVGAAPGLVLVDESGVAADADGRIKPKLMEALLAIHNAYPEQTEVWYGALEGLYYRSAQGWTVYLGNGEGMSSKISLLRSTEEEIISRGATVYTIDLRFPDQAILK